MPPKENSSRKRAYHPKSRTGCWSCRGRKVKCDEGKPGCQRCKNYGMRCAGYSPVRPILSAYQSLVETEPSTAISRPPSIPIISSMLQEQYFNIFFTRTGNAIIPFFGQSRWDFSWRTILMDGCHSEPAVFHSVVALGALEKACEAVRIEKTFRQSTVNHHHEFALKEYGQAIKLMRKAMEGGKQDLRIILVITLLIVCFEELHGNYESSTAQIRVALKLIEDWRAKYDTEDDLGSGFSSPAPYEIPDILVQIFGRLEIQTMLFVDTRPADVHARLKRTGTKVIECMPEIFNSVTEARVYLELIMRRYLHWIAQVNSNGPDVSAAHSEKCQTPQISLSLSSQSSVLILDEGRIPLHQEELSTRATLRAGSPLSRAVCDSLGHGFYQETTEAQSDLPKSDLPDIDDTFMLKKPSFFENPESFDDVSYSDEIHEEHSLKLSELHIWHGAFDPIFAAAKDTQHPEIVGIYCLKLHYLCSLITMQAKLSPLESIYDQYTTEFVEALSICTSLLTNLRPELGESGSSLRFTFDAGLLIPLFQIATKCRISSLRNQALNLMRTYQRREGNWDSELAAAIVEWVIRVEEEGILEDGTVPEKSRVRQLHLKAQFNKRKALITCQKWSEENGGFVMYRDTISW